MKLSELLKNAFKEGMTVEEVEKALESLTAADIAADEIKKHKDSFDKAASEVADLKKQLKGKMTEDEQAKTELEDLKTQIADMKRSSDIASKKADLISLGYEEKLADESAVAMVDGDGSKVLQNQRSFLEKKTKDIEADLLKKTPKPPQAGGKSGDNDKTEAEKIALKFAATATATNKSTTDIINQYTGGNKQ